MELLELLISDLGREVPVVVEDVRWLDDGNRLGCVAEQECPAHVGIKHDGAVIVLLLLGRQGLAERCVWVLLGTHGMFIELWHAVMAGRL